MDTDNIDLICTHAEVIAASETADEQKRQTLINNLTEKLFDLNGKHDGMKRYDIRKVLTAYMGSLCGTTEHRSALFEKLLIWDDPDQYRGIDSNKVSVFDAYLASGNILPAHKETLIKPQKDKILIPGHYVRRELDSLSYLLFFIQDKASNRDEVKTIVDATIRKLPGLKDIYCHPADEATIVLEYLKSPHADDNDKKKITDDLLVKMDNKCPEADIMLKWIMAGDYMPAAQIVHLRDELAKTERLKSYNNNCSVTDILSGYMQSKHVPLEEKVAFADTLVKRVREDETIQYAAHSVINGIIASDINKLELATITFDRMENDEDPNIAHMSAGLLSSIASGDNLTNDERKIMYDAMLAKFKEKCEAAEDLFAFANDENTKTYFKLCPHTQIAFLNTLDFRLNAQDTTQSMLPAKKDAQKIDIPYEVKVLVNKYDLPAFNGQALRISNGIGRKQERAVLLIAKDDITHSTAILEGKKSLPIFGPNGLQAGLVKEGQAFYADSELDTRRQYKEFLDISPEHSLFDEFITLKKRESFAPKIK